MTLLAIDPGPEVSGAVVLNEYTDPPTVWNVWPEIPTYRLLGADQAPTADHLAIEMVASYGMPVGATVFDTCVWIGRIAERFGWNNTTLVYRKAVKLHLCNSLSAKDANIRQAILDLYPRTGGGKTPQIGTKKEPGPLYGVEKHAWAALGVGITWQAERTV